MTTKDRNTLRGGLNALLLCSVPLALVQLIYLPAEADGNELDAPYWLDDTRACAPLCLSFIDKWYGSSRRYEDVAAACRPGPYGATLADVKDAATKFGYVVTPFNCDSGSLPLLRRPAILHLRPVSREVGSGRAEDHFVVLLPRESEATTNLVFNPPRNLSSLNDIDLSQHYTGVGLAISPPGESGAIDNIFESTQALRSGYIAFSAIWILLFYFTTSHILKLRRNQPAMPASLHRMTVICCLLNGMSCGCDTSASNIVVVSANQIPNYDAGSVLQGTTIRHVFRIQNPSPHPLKFVRVDGSCDCQEKRIIGQSPAIVLPGDAAEVEVSVPTSNEEGHLKKTFTVVTDCNDKRWSRLPFFIAAEVAAPFKILPSRIEFGRIAPNETLERRVDIIFTDPAWEQKYRDFNVKSPLIEAQLAARSKGMVSLQVSLHHQYSAGTLSSDIQLQFDDRDKPIMIPISAMLEGDLEVLPRAIDTSNRSSVVSLIVRSKERAAFSIRGIDCPSGMKCLESLPTKKMPEHKLTFSSDVDRTTTDGMVAIEVDHAQTSSVLVPLTGIK